MIISARSVSWAAIPACSSAFTRPISCVAIDLTLMTSFWPVAWTRSVTICVASSASRAQWTWAPRAVALRLELLEVAVEVVQDVVLDRGAGVAELLPVGGLGDEAGTPLP